MPEITDSDIKAAMLFKLYKLAKWGGSPTAFDNLKKGFKPQELSKKGLKRVEDNAEDLIKEGLILPKTTGYGLQVSLNPKMHIQIEREIREYVSERPYRASDRSDP